MPAEPCLTGALDAASCGVGAGGALLAPPEERRRYWGVGGHGDPGLAGDASAAALSGQLVCAGPPGLTLADDFSEPCSPGVPPPYGRSVTARPLFDAELAERYVGRGPRKLFISLLGIYKKYDKGGDRFRLSIPANALFLFGMKRSLVFPANRLEEHESRRESSKYMNPKYEWVRELILEKEARNQVMFLPPRDATPPESALTAGDREAYQSVSKWLEGHEDPVTGQRYVPLKLDGTWWRTRFQPTEKRYTATVDATIRNFECGTFDFAPTMELLFQSNATLDIIK